MVLSGRGNNEMFIDLKQAKVMPKVLNDCIDRELPRALKMAPAADVINLAIVSSGMQEVDRKDVSDQLLTDVMAKQKDLEDTIAQLKAVNSRLSSEQSALLDKVLSNESLIEPGV